MSETNEERCETCRFYVDTSTAHEKCRRYPPVVLLGALFIRSDDQSPGMEIWRYRHQTVLTDTIPSAWCGEYQPRGTTK